MKNAPKILSAAVAIALVAFRVFAWGGDEPEAPVTPPAVAATDAAAAGSGATQPVSTGGTTQPVAQPAASPTAAADEDADLPEQSAKFPAKFQNRVDRMCARAEDELETITRGGVKNMDELHAAIVVFENLATDFENAKPAARNKLAWRKYTGLVRDGANAIGRVEIEAADGDRPAFDALMPALKRFDARLVSSSNRYGFQDCADD